MLTGLRYLSEAGCGPLRVSTVGWRLGCLVNIRVGFPLFAPIEPSLRGGTCHRVKLVRASQVVTPGGLRLSGSALASGLSGLSSAREASVWQVLRTWAGPKRCCAALAHGGTSTHLHMDGATLTRRSGGGAPQVGTSVARGTALVTAFCALARSSPRMWRSPREHESACHHG